MMTTTRMKKPKTKSEAGADEATISPASCHSRLEPGFSLERIGAAMGRPAGLAAQDPGLVQRPYDPDRTEEDQDTGDVSEGVDEDELDRDDLDTDRVTSTETLAAAMRMGSLVVSTEFARSCC